MDDDFSVGNFKETFGQFPVVFAATKIVNFKPKQYILLTLTKWFFVPKLEHDNSIVTNKKT